MPEEEEETQQVEVEEVLDYSTHHGLVEEHLHLRNHHHLLYHHHDEVECIGVECVRIHHSCSTSLLQ